MTATQNFVSSSCTPQSRMNIVDPPRWPSGLVAAIFSCGDRFCSKFEPLDVLMRLEQPTSFLPPGRGSARRKSLKPRTALNSITGAFQNGDAICLMVHSIERWRAQTGPAQISSKKMNWTTLQKIVLERIKLAVKNDTLRNAPYLDDIFRFLSSSGVPRNGKLLREETSRRGLRAGRSAFAAAEQRRCQLRFRSSFHRRIHRPPPR